MSKTVFEQCERWVVKVKVKKTKIELYEATPVYQTNTDVFSWIDGGLFELEKNEIDETEECYYFESARPEHIPAHAKMIPDEPPKSYAELLNELRPYKELWLVTRDVCHSGMTGTDEHLYTDADGENEMELTECSPATAAKIASEKLDINVTRKHSASDSYTQYALQGVK